MKTLGFYFFGRTFCITNDHKSLQTQLRECKAIPIMASAPIQRWALTLSAYSYSFKYTPGKIIGHADSMSRLPPTTEPESVPIPAESIFLVNFLDSSPLTAEEIEKKYHTDPVLLRVKWFIMNGWTHFDAPELIPYHA